LALIYVTLYRVGSDTERPIWHRYHDRQPTRSRSCCNRRRIVSLYSAALPAGSRWL